MVIGLVGMRGLFSDVGGWGVGEESEEEIER